MDVLSAIISFFSSNLIDRIRRLFAQNFKIEILVCQESPPPGEYSFLFQRLTDIGGPVKNGHPDHNAVVRIHFKIVNRAGKVLALRDMALDVFFDNRWMHTLPHHWISFRGDNNWVSLHQNMPDFLKESLNMQPDEEQTLKVAYSLRATRSLDGINVRLKAKDSRNKWSRGENWVPRHPDY